MWKRVMRWWYLRKLRKKKREGKMRYEGVRWSGRPER